MPGFEPEVDLARKAKAIASRVGETPRAFEVLRGDRGGIAPGTESLAVPVQIVIGHEHLAPLSGVIPHCNEAGNPDHNPRLPVFFWYQDTPVGKEVYSVFYTKPCEWGRCSFCTLPSESSPRDITSEQIYLQALFVFDSLTPLERSQVRRLFISNNGSVLNPATMPEDALLRICEQAHIEFPNLEIVCFETRVETATVQRLREIQRLCLDWHGKARGMAHSRRQLARPATCQISTGYETQDPYLRNAILWKGYDEGKFQDFLARCAEVQKESGHPIWIDEYVMLKPAIGLSDEEATEEAAETILHLERLGRHFGLAMSIRLNPTFAAVGSELYLQFEQKRYAPPSYRDVFRVLGRCHEQGATIPIFLGLNNEGLAYSQGSFGNRDATDPDYLRALQAYNAHQDFQRLQAEVRAIEQRAGRPEEIELVQELRLLGADLARLGELDVPDFDGLIAAIRKDLTKDQILGLSKASAIIRDRLGRRPGSQDTAQAASKVSRS